MAAPYVIAVEGLAAAGERIRSLADLDPTMRMSVNRTIDWARTQASRAIREQVNFTAKYLDDKSDGRLQVTQRARGDNLEAIITGRHRPTSLAQFSETRDPGLTRRQGYVNVEVHPGSKVKMERAFLMRLRAGSQLTDTQYNLGLAIRLRPGEKLANKTKIMQIQSNLVLLYGPSVDQIFRSVAPEIQPDVSAYLEKEFERLLEVKINGKS